MPLGTEVGLDQSDIVLYGDPALPSLKEHSPQFSAYVRSSQTAGWTKMPLDIEVVLGHGDYVLDGDPAPQKKRHSLPPNFRPMSIVTKRLDG